MLMPKRVKYRKIMRGINKGVATRGSKLSFGEFGLKSEDRNVLTSRQIEAARKAITHKTKRGGKLWIRVFPHKAVSKKPAETRMGSGKSAPDHFVAIIKPGKMLFEISGVTEDLARKAFERASSKLPVKTRFVKSE